MKKKSSIKRRLASIVDPTHKKGRALKKLSAKERLRRKHLSKVRNKRKTAHDHVFDKGRAKVLHRRRTGKKSVTAGKGKGRKHKLKWTEEEKQKRSRNNRWKAVKTVAKVAVAGTLGYLGGKALGKHIAGKYLKKGASSAGHTSAGHTSGFSDSFENFANKVKERAKKAKDNNKIMEESEKAVKEGTSSLAKHQVQQVSHKASQAERNTAAKKLRATRKDIRSHLDKGVEAFTDSARNVGADVDSKHLRKALGSGSVRVRKQEKARLQRMSTEQRGFKSNVSKAQARKVKANNQKSASSYSVPTSKALVPHSLKRLSKLSPSQKRKRANNRRERHISDFM